MARSSRGTGLLNFVALMVQCEVILGRFHPEKGQFPDEI